MTAPSRRDWRAPVRGVRLSCLQLPGKDEFYVTPWPFPASRLYFKLSFAGCQAVFAEESLYPMQFHLDVTV